MVGLYVTIYTLTDNFTWAGSLSQSSISRPKRRDHRAAQKSPQT
nr:MAG TPA: hypothetical protein [Caudoviricetes sp.]